MNPQELRIGNYVERTAGIMPVAGIIQEGAWFDDGDCEAFKYLQPIPLSPEILQAAGFHKTGGDFSSSFYLDSEGNELYFSGDVVSWEFDGKSIIREIRYLHQLQNAYYVLNGAELPLSLPTLK